MQPFTVNLWACTDVHNLCGLLVNSIGSLLRAIGRILRAHQDARILQTQVPEVPFNVMSDFRFKKAQVTVSETISLASRLGTGRRRKRVGVLTLGDEAAMLAKSTYVNDTAKGCSMRFAYFCTRNFFIRGSTALHELTDLDFTLGSDEHGEFLRYVKAATVVFLDDGFWTITTCTCVQFLLL